MMSTQHTADQIKRILDALHPTPSQRQANPAVYEMLQRFERAAWHGPAWADVIAEAEGLALDDDGRLSADISAATAESLYSAMSRFLMLTEQQELPSLFSVDEAAAYLGTTPRAILHHHHNSGKLKGKVVRGIYFTRDQLDDFKNNWPQPGRPRGNDQSQTDSTAEDEPIGNE